MKPAKKTNNHFPKWPRSGQISVAPGERSVTRGQNGRYGQNGQRRRLTITTIIASIALLISGCGEDMMKYDVTLDTPIVESYLEEGKNSITVKVYSMEYYSDDEYILSKPVTGLSLQVNESNLSETTSGTYSLELGETISGLQDFDLKFDYKGKAVKGSTTVPLPVTGLKVEPAFMERTTYYYPGSGSDTIDITLSWNDPDHSYYQVYIESPSSSSTIGGGFPGGQFGKRMMQPFQGNSYQLNAMEFSSVGNYIIYVYRVNKDYVELYERISSTDLANPVSFIDNAFGVFTSMSAAKVAFRVTQSE